MAFVKLDCAALDSSLWADPVPRDLFLTALLMAVPFELKEPTPQLNIRNLDPTGWIVPPGWYGLIEAASNGIGRKAVLDDKEALYAGLETLGAPDAESKSPEYDGRRLVRIKGGFLALNFIAYRERDHGSAERSRRYRQRIKSVTPSHRDDTGEHRSVTEAEADAEKNLRKDGAQGAGGAEKGKTIQFPAPGNELAWQRLAKRLKVQSKTGESWPDFQSRIHEAAAKGRKQ